MSNPPPIAGEAAGYCPKPKGSVEGAGAFEAGIYGAPKSNPPIAAGCYYGDGATPQGSLVPEGSGALPPKKSGTPPLGFLTAYFCYY
jgi:hypothetical protein